jgi:hypothetical protein
MSIFSRVTKHDHQQLCEVVEDLATALKKVRNNLRASGGKLGYLEKRIRNIENLLQTPTVYADPTNYDIDEEPQEVINGLDRDEQRRRLGRPAN